MTRGAAVQNNAKAPKNTATRPTMNSLKHQASSRTTHYDPVSYRFDARQLPRMRFAASAERSVVLVLEQRAPSHTILLIDIASETSQGKSRRTVDPSSAQLRSALVSDRTAAFGVAPARVTLAARANRGGPATNKRHANWRSSKRNARLRVNYSNRSEASRASHRMTLKGVVMGIDTRSSIAPTPKQR